MGWSLFFAAVASASFGILFHIRGRNLLLAGLNGGLGYFIYAITVANAYESYIGMFFASFIMALVAEVSARLWKAPASIFLAAALIPIVPGGGMFRCALSLLEGNIQAALEYGIATVLDAVAIAIGIIVVSSLTKVLTRRKPKYEK